MNTATNKPGLFTGYKTFFLNEDWIDFGLKHINPLLSVNAIKARVEEIKTETPDTKTIYLRPNLNWKGHRAGQHITLTAEVNGTLLKRVFTLSSAPHEELLSITVKKQEKGKVTPFLHEKLKKGDILEISAPAGEFTVPAIIPAKLLFIAGGSGITPVYSILKSLAYNNYRGEIQLLYYSRSKENCIFFNELQELAKEILNLNVYFLFTEEKEVGYLSGEFSRKSLSVLVPDYENYSTYLCGPSGLMESVRSTWKEKNITEKLIYENFKPLQLSSAKSKTGLKKINLTKSGKSVEVKGEKPLLIELEEQGINHPSGCRMGICFTCSCNKKDGIAENLLNGKFTSEGEDTIQLCISSAETDLDLEI